MRRIVLLATLALIGCVACRDRTEDTVLCDHLNDRAAWAGSGMSAASYDSAMKAQNKRCIP